MYRARYSNATARGAQDRGEADGNECSGRLRHADTLNCSGRATCKYLQLGDGATGGAIRLRFPSERYVRRAAVSKCLVVLWVSKRSRRVVGGNWLHVQGEGRSCFRTGGATGVNRAKNSVGRSLEVDAQGWLEAMRSEDSTQRDRVVETCECRYKISASEKETDDQWQAR